MSAVATEDACASIIPVMSAVSGKDADVGLGC
jgi:hypothetical protein